MTPNCIKPQISFLCGKNNMWQYKLYCDKTVSLGVPILQAWVEVALLTKYHSNCCVARKH